MINKFTYYKKANLLIPAFTIIELLVAIAIIGLLASAISLYFFQALKKNRDDRRRADLALMSDAVEKFYNDHRIYPPTPPPAGEGCGASINFVIYTDWTSDITCYAYQQDPYVPSIVPDYLQKMPHDPYFPTSSATQGYMYRSDGQNYKLWANQSVELYPVSATDPFYNQGIFGGKTKTFQISSPGGANW